MKQYITKNIIQAIFLAFIFLIISFWILVVDNKLNPLSLFFGFLFVVLISEIKVLFLEIYHWNNGYSRENGLPWIEHIKNDSYQLYNAGNDTSITLHLEHFKPKNYDLKEALVKLNSHQLITNLKHFD